MRREQETGVVVRLDIPPDYHPAVIKGESPGANSGRAALQHLYEAYGKINDLSMHLTELRDGRRRLPEPVDAAATPNPGKRKIGVYRPHARA